MTLRKITDRDLQGYGVVGMADTPNLSARQMQEKVEEVVRSVVIPIMNENIDSTASKQDLAEAVFNAGAGDMLAANYDSNLDGIVNKADNGFFTYNHTKAGNIHYLDGYGDNVKFVSTADFQQGDVFMLGDNYYPAFVTSGDTLPDGYFKKDFVVTCFRHGNCLNFINGGAGLNFTVVGSTAQPASPAENTIWIDTTVDKEAVAEESAQLETTLLEMYINTSTGALTAASSNTCYTRYFACEPGCEYNFKLTDGQTVLIAAYTQLPAKGVTGTVLYGSGKTTGLATLDYTVTAPADAAYLAIWFYDSSQNSSVPVLQVTDKTLEAEIFATLPDSIPVTEWCFAPVMPQDMAYGGVWIKTGASSPVKLDVLKKNSICLLPQSSMQWDGQAWRRKNILIYSDGQWKMLQQYLVENGSYEGLTVWTKGGTASSALELTGNTVYNDVNVFKIYLGGTGVASVASEPVDLTAYSVLEFDVITDSASQGYQTSPYKAYRYGVVAENVADVYESNVNIITNAGNFVVSATGGHTTLETVRLDISALNGNYCIACAIQSSGSGIKATMGIANIRLA